MPERRPNSWPPPCTIGSRTAPARTYSTPTPFGPSNLCAEIESKSTPSAAGSTSSQPGAWTASGMKEHAALARDLREFGDRRDRTDFVVRIEDRGQDGVRPQRRRKRRRIDRAAFVDAQQFDVVPLRRERVQGMDDRVVVDRRRQHVPLPAGGSHGAENRRVVGLGPAAGKDDLLARDAQAGGDAIARVVEPRARAPAFGVDRTRVVRVGACLFHGIRDLAAQRRRRGVIEINSHHRRVLTGPSKAPILPSCCAKLQRTNAPRSSNGKRRFEVTRAAFFSCVRPPRAASAPRSPGT